MQSLFQLSIRRAGKRNTLQGLQEIQKGGQTMWKEIKEDILEIGSVLIGAGAIYLFLLIGTILG